MTIILVLITYDVNSTDAAGRKRLRQVAKQCVNYGQRVQNSVFECVIEPVLFKQLQHKLENIIDVEKDSLRYYFLGKNYQNKVEHVGAKPSFDVEGVLMV